MQKQIFLALTIFCSAGLVFLIQPIVAKQLLPVFGGAASVWIACLLFFQSALLVGYVYAHALRAWFTPRLQGLIHLVLVIAASFLAYLTRDLSPGVSGSPIVVLLFVLTLKVGLAAVVTSAASPLIQHWYSLQFNRPYRLYALSNLASLIALLSYPFLLEPNINLSGQYDIWLAGLGTYSVLCLICAIYLFSFVGTTVKTSFSASNSQRLWWIGFSLGGSILLLATTNIITREIAPIPFLWVLPLALYLITFMIAFDNENWYRRSLVIPGFLLALSLLVLIQSTSTAVSIQWQLVLYSAVLFFGCLAAHGEVARLKPEIEGLTEFFIFVSFGGFLGSVLVNLLAPFLFSKYYEFELGLLFITSLIFIRILKTNQPNLRWKRSFATFFVLGLSSLMLKTVVDESKNDIFSYRNFHGSLQVTAHGLDKPGARIQMYHDGIIHGSEFLEHQYRRIPVTYYSANSGIGLALLNIKTSQRRIGVIGLGAGALASYGDFGDTIQFFEINPAMEPVARKIFYYLESASATIEVIEGDARMSLEQMETGKFDVLVIDAFNGGAIPFHLLTEEAWQLYWNRLKAEGVLAIHVSNKYLNLVPVVLHHNLQDPKGTFIIIDNEDNPAWGVTAATWLIITNNQQLLVAEDFTTVAKVPFPGEPTVRWTDESSSILPLIFLRSSK